MSWRAIWDQLVSYGPLGMFVIAVVDTAFLPTAQAVDLMVVMQAAAAPEMALPLFVCMVMGSSVGAVILWSIARSGGAWALRRSIKEDKIERVREKIRKYDAAALVIPSFLPIPGSPMKLFIFAAGALDISPMRIAVAVGLGKVGRYGLMIGLGLWLGDDAWPLIKQHGATVAVVALALIAIVFALRARRSVHTDAPES
ncbi:MAG: VTT domain-containing protein [Bryobacterales bacterium]|nr:VTT domain-containing protein [Acidobacteriota bacterium]MCB9384610.1 VTT domain-containing protein [Bryobacterales bacterium]